MQKLLGIFAGLLIILSSTLPGWAAGGRPLVVIDASTGQILREESATQSWYPASLTKLLTAYVVFDAIRKGEITLDTPLTYSALAMAEPPAKMGFKPGTVITVDNALKMLIVRSANDIAVMIAENLGGAEGVDGFVRRMNAMAAHLGMTGSHFINPNGLPGEGQVSTARDMAMLAQAIYRDFPQHAGYFSIGGLKFGERTLRAYNLLLGRYDGADGMKTGFICSSGFNLVASASRGGRRLIVVVMGSTSGRARAETAARMLEDGFTHAAGAGAPIISALHASIGEPTDLREEICLKRPVTKAAAGEADGMEAGDSSKGDDRPVLAAKAGPVNIASVFVGPNPKSKGAPPPALSSSAPLALTSSEPFPKPLSDDARALDPAEFVREVRRAVAGDAPPRASRRNGANLVTDAATTTPVLPSHAPTPSVPMPQARPQTTP